MQSVEVELVQLDHQLFRIENQFSMLYLRLNLKLN